jgi:RND superfamily putative drug exporter
VVLLAWLGFAGALTLVAPVGDATIGETAELLPANTPVHAGLNALATHFGDRSALSSAVVVFERKEGRLSSDDLADIERVATQMGMPLPGDNPDPAMTAVSIRSPMFFAMAGKGNPLISADGHAALVWVSLPFNYITKSAARVVRHVQAVVANHAMRPGVTAAVTGSAGYGYDYAVAIERSHDKTSVVTFIAVTIILLLVYRAPIAAIIPLLGISIAAVVTFKILGFAERYGLHDGTAERIFTFVLLYGAGVDYSLLLMGRYREFLEQGEPPAAAVQMAHRASLPTIISSAAMTIAGLMMLCFARFSVFKNAGPGVVLAIFVAAVGATTLVPAILGIVGPVTFWPDCHSRRARQSILWSAIARRVIERPWTVMLITSFCLIIPAIQGARIRWDYDALFSLKPMYRARMGTEKVERHWPSGETAPLTLVAVSEHPQPDAFWQDASTKLVEAIRTNPDVQNVRALSLPLGLGGNTSGSSALLLLAHKPIHDEYIGTDGEAMRINVVLKVSPLTRSAMNDAVEIEKIAAAQNLRLTFYLTGATAEMIDMRDLTQKDFRFVAILSLLAILLVVWLVLRDMGVAVLILSATVLSYLTTLGLSYWFFKLLGYDGLEWKVQMLLFMVLIAVGQDYSIFFAIRLAQEARTLPCKEAVQKALVFTGPVISSCGLIMAATLGSVMAGDVRVLVELGFAFALGMLIDTFIVRPLLLPSVIVVTGKTLRRSPVGSLWHRG